MSVSDGAISAPGDGAEAGRETPADHEQAADRQARERGGLRVDRDRAQREPELRAEEEQLQQDHDADDHQGRADRADAHHRAEDVDVLHREQRRELQVVEAPDPAAEAGDEGEQADRHHDRGVGVAPLEAAHQEALDERAEHERHQDRQQDREDQRHAPLDERVREVGREHGHAALGEVDQPGRLIHQHDGQRERRVDRAGREAVDDELDEGAHAQPPR